MHSAPPPSPPSPSASSSSAAPLADGPARRDAWALLFLSAASGAADAFVFLCVGQVFAGVMTGNLVLLGASAAGAGEDGVALRVVTALAAYACGAASGALMAGRLGLRLGVMLLAETVLLGAAAALWGLDLVASYGDRLGLLALVSLAMGVQGRIGVTPTNYFTGTLTSLAAARRYGSWSRRTSGCWAGWGRWWPGRRSRPWRSGGGAPGPRWGRWCWRWERWS
ncbi:YoaK family protein [Streptomyces microflavus]